MIAYIQVDPRATPDPGIRETLIEGTYDGDDFVVKLIRLKVLGHDRPPKIILQRDGHDDVEITAQSLLRGVFVALDEGGDESWQPMTPADMITDGGARRELTDDEEAWSNDLYTAMVVRRTMPGVPGELVHISFHRHDKAPVRDWRHAQQIKNDIVGPEAEGIELYPAESRMVDMANQYHLWVLAEGRWPIGFDEGRKVLSAAETEALMLGTAQQRDPGGTA